MTFRSKIKQKRKEKHWIKKANPAEAQHCHNFSGRCFGVFVVNLVQVLFYRENIVYFPSS